MVGALTARDRLAGPTPVDVGTGAPDSCDAPDTAGASLLPAPVRPGGGARAPPRDRSRSDSVTS